MKHHGPFKAARSGIQPELARQPCSVRAVSNSQRRWQPAVAEERDSPPEPLKSLNNRCGVTVYSLRLCSSSAMKPSSAMNSLSDFSVTTLGLNSTTVVSFG